MRGLVRVIGGLGVVGLVAGCVVPGLPAPTSSRAEVLDGALTLAAPRGYCVDPTSRNEGIDGTFVLWGNCAAISGNASAPHPEQMALLSATVGPPSGGALEASFDGFEAFFRSGAGRAALARSGQGEDVSIDAVERAEGLLLLKITDRSAPGVAPVEPTYWRAITDLGGHVGALSVLPMRGAPLDDSAQVALLRSFEQTIRAAN